MIWTYKSQTPQYTFRTSETSSVPECISAHFLARSDWRSSSRLCWGCFSSASQSTPSSALVWQTQDTDKAFESAEMVEPHFTLDYTTRYSIFVFDKKRLSLAFKLNCYYKKGITQIKLWYTEGKKTLCNLYTNIQKVTIWRIIFLFKEALW